VTHDAVHEQRFNLLDGLILLDQRIKDFMEVCRIAFRAGSARLNTQRPEISGLAAV